MRLTGIMPHFTDKRYYWLFIINYICHVKNGYLKGVLKTFTEYQDVLNTVDVL